MIPAARCSTVEAAASGVVVVRGLVPAHHRTDARLQFTHAERLGEVVIGAAVEPDDDVGLGVAGGEHQDGRVGVRAGRAHRAAERDAVEPGQHHVEHEQVECRRPRDVEGLAPVPEVLDREACQPQVELQQFTDGRIVLHDEHPSAFSLRHWVAGMVPRLREY